MAMLPWRACFTLPARAHDVDQVPRADWLGDVPWLSWGRIRYAHTQGLFFGWLGNAFLAFLYFAVPRLAGRPVTSARLGWALFVTWNGLMVLPGWALVQAGVSQPLEWAEFPLPIDGAATLGMLLACIQFVVPLCPATVSSLYVSAWYILGGLTFTLLAYPVGNVVPEYLPGTLGATFSGLWIHDAVGLFVTPLALAIPYAVIPAVSRQPIYSHFLSMIGFWLLFLLYPLNGTHHFVFSSIPMEAQKGAVVASVYLGADVVLVVTNLLLSLRGRSGTAAADTPLRYVWAGTVVYLIVSLQGSAQAIMPLNRFVHFSDWVIGHSHLAMIGFGSFMALGGLLHAWRLTPGCRYSPRLANWSFWLLALGLAGMVLDLTAAGLVQGQLWQGDLPWMDSVRASAPFWWVRSVSGFVLLAGFVAVVAAITIGPVACPRLPRCRRPKRANSAMPTTRWPGSSGCRMHMCSPPGLGSGCSPSPSWSWGSGPIARSRSRSPGPSRPAARPRRKASIGDDMSTPKRAA